MNTGLKLLLRKISDPALDQRLAIGIYYYFSSGPFDRPFDPTIIGNDCYFITSLASRDQ
ncbi:hypothetical protein D3C77_280190 [compost metagenome]